jgi:hypothetical protein
MPPSLPTADRPPCFAVRLCAELKRLALLAILIGLLAIAGKYYCFDRLNEEIRVRFETALREHYQGLKVTVKSARRVAGQGVEIRGVRIAEAGGKAAPVIAEIDEIFAQCDTRLPDFLTKPPSITSLRVHRLKLRAERKPSGSWNLSHLLPLPPCQSRTAPIATISDAALEIVDPTQPAESGPCAWSLRNIELTVEPEAANKAISTLLRIHGTLAGDHIERVEIDGLLDPLTSRWEVRGAVEGLEFSPRLRSALPRELSAALAPLSSIRGRTFFGFHAARGARDSSPHAPREESISRSEMPTVQFTVHGKISEGRIDDARLPEPLTDVEARIRCDNHGLLIDDLSARCGATQIELHASVAGYSGTGPIDLELTARQLQLEHLPTAALPPAVRATWDHFQPRGLADVAGRLKFDGQQWLPELKIECHELSLAYNRFPYRLTDGSGTIIVAPDALSARLRMVGGGRFVRCTADIHHPGPSFTGRVELQSEGAIAIDDRLLLAMDAPTQRLVRGFRPRGSASFFARFERTSATAEIRRQIQIDLLDCSMQHERFPYPIDRVCGTLALDDDTWLFKNLTGQNDSAEITGAGSWAASSSAGRQLVLHFAARDVPLADELRAALPVATQQLWSNLRPRGNVDQLHVDLRYSPANQHWSIDVQADKWQPQTSDEGRTLSLVPAWFRYGLNNVTGSFRYRDGRMQLSNLRAAHGRATIVAEGNCALLAAGGCRLDLTKFAADRVEVDRELLDALPGGLGASLARFPLEGPVNVQGTLGIVVAPQPEILPHVAWDLNLDVENGRLLTATPVEHLYGGMTLSGRQSGEGLFARGELRVDSAMIRGIQLTSVQGPYWIDGRRLVFGTLADSETKNRAPRQLTARLLSGLLSLDGEVLLTGEGTFDVEATLANADLAEVARQLAPHQPAASGKVFGTARIGGNSQGKHTWHGNGQISLREADLYELPAMINLLKLLSVQRPQRANTAFTNSNIDFRIEGDDLAFERIDFSGDAISLKGKGRMNAQRQIDLQFYPLVGREERHLPIFRPLLGETGREFMLIEVTGTLDQPQIDRQVFPRLDARLAQLFPELAREEAALPNAPVGPPPREAGNWLRPFQRR